MFFRRDMEPSCSYCIYGTDIGHGEIVCRNCGIMAAGGYCSAFFYEPTKRVPEFSRSLRIENINEKDFSIQ